MKKVLVALGIVLGATGIAQAGRIATPAVTRSNSQNSRLACAVANEKTALVGPFTISVMRQTGVLAAALNVASLQPGVATSVVADDIDLAGSTLGYCVVEGNGVSAKKTPVTLCVVSAATDDCLAAVIGR